MPVPTDTLRNMPRLNVVFAFSSVLTLATMGWMLWADYDRPWRATQLDYFNLRSAMAHFSSLAFESPEEQARRRRLEDAVRQAEAGLATGPMKSRMEELERRDREVDGHLQGVALTFGNLNAELQVKLFRVEESKTLLGPNHPQTQAFQADYEASAAALAEVQAKKEKLEDGKRELRAEIKRLTAQRVEAQKALALYDKGVNDARRLDAMYGPGFQRATFNFPGLDFLAPKGIPGRQEVKQVFTKSIRFDYNFLDSYVTDRCTTCHVGIDDPALTLENFAHKTSQALSAQAVRDVLSKQNQRIIQDLVGRRLPRAVQDTDLAARDVSEMDEATRIRFVRAMVAGANDFLLEMGWPAIDPDASIRSLGDPKSLTRKKITDLVVTDFSRRLTAAPPLSPDGRRPLDWRDMSSGQRMGYVASLTAAMNLYLVEVGRPKIDMKAELRAHPHLELYVGQDSPHPLKIMGCTVCHEGSGQETDFVLAAHTPKDRSQEQEWKRNYYVRHLKVPESTFELVEDFWERPMLLSDYTSASCRKCHSQTFDLERHQTLPLESAHRIVEGRDLFTTVGCINCHNVEGLSDSRRVGPDLRHVGEKLSTGFMERWMEYPANFRPSTRMPHFFRQENNLPASANEFDPDPMLRTETEIQAITHYLRTFSTPYHPLPTPEGKTGDPKRGEELFVSIGCLGCHANLAAKDPLDGEGHTFAERWITADLMHAQGLSAEEAKKRFDAMSATDRARYASHHFTKERREAAQRTRQVEEVEADREGREPAPEKLYLPPVLTRFAPELSGLGSKLVADPKDDGQVAQATRWLYDWLHEPRHYSSSTKMPRLFRDHYYWASAEPEQRKRNDQDILDVAAFLLSLRNDEFDAKPFADDQRHQAEMCRLVLELLGGQNTQSVSERILADAKDTPSQPYGRLSTAIVDLVAKSFGPGAEGRRRVETLIRERSNSLPQRQRLYLGMKMIAHYGCYACHSIAGFDDATRPGTDLTTWGQKFLSQIDFAFYSPPFEHEVEEQPETFGMLYPDSAECEHLVRDVGGNVPQEILHNHASFAYHKLRNPRIWDRKKIKKPYDKLKMPNFFFSDEEARSLVTWLLSLKNANVTKSVQIPYETTPAGKIAKGRALVRELNCIGCHTIEGNEANIQPYYSRDPSRPDSDPFGARFMPPLLWGEGAKVQYPWLFSFLNNVEMLRPWLHARMPSFHFTEDQTTTLVGYFAGMSQHESKLLKGDLERVRKYVQEVHAAGGAADAGATWFADEKLAGPRDFLARYGVAKEQIRPFDLNPGPAQSEAEQIANLVPTFQKLIDRGSFLARLFAVDYPFAAPPPPDAEDDRFRLGEEFFYNQKCLACHVAGDPSVPGTTADIKAPNFALSHKRLRYDWIINWVQDPQAIQPGANMPQIFQGGSAFGSLSAEERAKLEGKFGKTADEQAHLLVDFLFTLGERRYTAIQPGGAAAPAAAQPAGGPGGGFDFEPAPSASQPASSQPAKQEFDF